PVEVHPSTVAGPRATTSIREPTTAGPPIRTAERSANVSRFQRVQTSTTAFGRPTFRRLRAICLGTALTRPTSAWMLWLTSCRTAPSVHGFVSRWYGSSTSGNGLSCLPSLLKAMPRLYVAGEKPVAMYEKGGGAGTDLAWPRPM